MSAENVEIVRASLVPFNAGDINAWEDFLAPDVSERKILAFEFFWDYAEALEAAGLSK
jgi:hypothetical protein